MKKTILTTCSAILAFCLSAGFTSCDGGNDDPDYAELLVGEWLYVDDTYTDGSFVLSFAADGTGRSRGMYYLGETLGFDWRDDLISYTLDGNLISLSGTVTGVSFSATMRIDAIGAQTLDVTILSYLWGGTSIPQYLGAQTAVRTTRDASYLYGNWKATYPTLDNLDNYYVFKENGDILCYEEDEPGTWSLYEHEEFYCYGDFVGWFWKDSNDPADFTFYEGFVVTDRQTDSFTLFNNNYGVTEEIYFTRVSASEIPVP